VKCCLPPSLLPITFPPPALFHSPALPFLYSTYRLSLALRTGCECSCAERGSGIGVYGWWPRVLVIAAGSGHGCEMLSAPIPSSHHYPAVRPSPLTCAALPALARPSLALRTGRGCSCAERGSGSGVCGWRPRMLVIAAGGGHGC
jgi:hypothetical protein